MGDSVQCGYHGLAFDSTGQCVHNPFSDKIPAAAKVQSWAVVERHDIIWLWGGSPEEANPELIPDFSMITNSGTVKAVHGYTLIEAPYEFATDNLMDLSHIEFVHKGSFAGAGVIIAGTHQVVEEGDTLRSNWWMPGVKAPSRTAGIYPPDMICDHRLDMRWDAPALMHRKPCLGGVRQDLCLCKLCARFQIGRDQCVRPSAEYTESASSFHGRGSSRAQYDL